MSKLYDKAAAAVKKRNYDYAIELFLQELTRSPDNADARRALRAAELKKFQEAGKEPDSASAYLSGLGALLGATFHGLSKSYEKAMLSCEQFLKRAPRNKPMLKRLGDLALLAGHNQAARVAFEELLDTDRESLHALRSLARICREEDDIAQALAFFERLLRVDPSDGEAAKAVRDLAASGASQRVADRRAAGDGSFRDMMKDSHRARKLETAGKKARTTKEIDQAIEDLREECDGSKDDARRLKKIGDLYLRKRALDDAVASYEKALTLKKDAQTQDALGDVRLKRFDYAMQDLAKKAKRGDKTALKKLKGLKGERIGIAISEYERRVKARPTELGLKFQLGAQLFKAKRFDDAIVHLQKAAGDARRGAQARTTLGKCFAAKGMFDMAVKEFKKAQDKSPNMDETGKDIAYALALVLEKAGRTEKAAEEFERIVEVDIGYRDAMKRLEALQKA